jgi:tetratricopeptide (TPR) repeat protein
MFCMLGVFPGTEFSVNAAATLLGQSVAASHASLGELAVANMIQPRATDRFGCHDLLRAYAQSLAASVLDPAERQGALERLCKSYLKTIDKAAQLIYPHLFRLSLPDVSSTPAQAEFDNDLEALCWLDLEQGNIAAIIRTAGTHGPRHLAWLLADSLRGYLYHRQNTVEWFAVAEAGLAAAVAEDDALGQAAAHHSLALASHSISDFPGAIKHLHQARRLSEQGGWRHGHTAALCNLGIIATDQGQLSAAESYYTQALEANRSDGIDVAMAVNLGNLAEVHHMLGNLESAERFARAALDRYLMANSPTGQANVLTCLGAVCRELDKTYESGEYLRQSLEMQRDIGDRGGQANALAELSLLLRQTGRQADSVNAADEAIRLSELLNDHKLEAKAHNAMAIARYTQGRRIEARTHYHDASAAAAKAGTPYQHVIALIGLANACRDSDELTDASRYGKHAWELARASSYRLLEIEAQAIIVASRTSHPA